MNALVTVEKNIVSDRVESVIKTCSCVFNVTSIFSEGMPLSDLLMMTAKEKFRSNEAFSSDKAPFSEYNNTKGKIHIDVQ